MPKSSFLAGQLFDPETITKMSAAFEDVREVLEPKVGAATRLFAQKIIGARPKGTEGRGHVIVNPTAGG
jgi:hypothetical protein